MKKRKGNTCLESRLRYQEIYIRYLENELIKRMSNVEKEEHMRFDYECKRTPMKELWNLQEKIWLIGKEIN